MVHMVLTHHLCFLLISMLACRCPAVSGLFEWLRRTETASPPAVAAPPAVPALLSKDAQFEMATADEKFLSEAKHMEISPLDGCHYRVVARLKASCESLSEEQLAKLGVILFNCQAESEGRRTYSCTEEMTLKECTADMDSDTWNAYHIISNRARSVCYAARQQLFRRRAEHTVNALISTATSQLDAMKDLKEGQLELKELTAASLDKLLDGHSALQAQQGKLYEGQEQMESSLRDNLQRLSQEKALIASGQELVAQLIQGITKRMENVSEHLQIQGSEVQDGHKAIVEDLADVRDRAQDIYQKIDHSMLEFLQYQDQTSQYYTDLMNKLERMNSTLGVVLHFLDNMQIRVEERLHMIQGYLGWAGLSLTAMWTCISHTGYFVLCAVVLTFLRCAGFPRAMLLLSVPLNAVAELNQQPALDLGGLSLLLLALSLGHWFVSQLWACFQIRAKPAAPLPLVPCNIVEPQKQPVSSRRSYPPSSTPQKEEKDTFMERDDLLDQDGFVSGDFGISAVSPPHRKPVSEFVPIMRTHNHSTPRLVPQPALSAALVDDIPLRNLGSVFDAANDSRDLVSDSRSASPTPSLVSNSSLSGRQLCNGVTKTGKACKKRAVLGHEYCRVHEGGHASYVHS
uniref:protein brambleberry n=1 Tax=Scatophagus argus TaxID=75038 RepID=UPI001ED84FEA|nr:protein brambleberry [Scatophagus argus]XP_046246745.1 protein brambleberry [Scatophagus argus]XP_046246746.1 protein brambleberry [Scatophagus argus]XP_046246747.1 protein brambleberry [Scatophagus argus]